MRQIIVNEPNINLKYIYFLILMSDGVTPANNEENKQPEININGEGWDASNIGPLQNLNFGNYRALLSDASISVIGNIILSHYISDNTLDSFGEPIEVVQNLTLSPIFESTLPTPTILSYVSLPEAENYFATKLNVSIWNNAVPQDKIKALHSATIDIDQLSFSGIKVSPTQLLQFPRYILTSPRHYITIFPDDIKFATCEIAYNYLDGVDMEEEINKITVESHSYSSLGDSFNRVSVNEARRAGINSNKAWVYLRPYLNDPHALRLSIR